MKIIITDSMIAEAILFLFPNESITAVSTRLLDSAKRYKTQGSVWHKICEQMFPTAYSTTIDKHVAKCATRFSRNCDKIKAIIAESSPILAKETRKPYSPGFILEDCSDNSEIYHNFTDGVENNRLSPILIDETKENYSPPLTSL